LHDCGNAVVRERHWEQSVALAQPILERLLSRAYRSPLREKIVLNILEVIHSHDSAVPAYSLEGSIVKLADAMDCEGGRSRLPPAMQNPDRRYGASSQAIDFVHLGPITPGSLLPIWVEMNSKDGLFQLEGNMAPRLDSGVLQKQVVLEAFISGKKVWSHPK
ncbi:MAG: hypothetical protein M1530_03755, partial [Candidatus Marsarchaeota archaeon]|nr:hypothetical protein [Candidatus Marsarchaeota archaeon]